MHEIFLSDLKSRLFIKQKNKALNSADCIVCISNNTKVDLFKFYPELRKKRVEVISNGVSDFHPTKTLASLPRNLFDLNSDSYFLYVGNRGFCKGFSMVHEVIDLLNRKIPCIVVGEAFTNHEKITIKKRGHEHLIKNIGFQTDQTLNILYSRSLFFFFPSLYEGFGLPLLEAMSSGALILASNTSSIPEVAQDAVIYFEPYNISSLKSAISAINQNTKKDLTKKGFAICKSYSWSSSISRYNNLYQDLYTELLE
jgi:mannosyltransferase